MASSSRREMRTLSDMLERERFLTKVLGYLVEDGLHECRLVCRRWYDVCSRLPVHLAISNAKHAHEIAQKFPNAVAVKSQSRMVFSYMYTNCIFTDFLQHLLPLTGLKHLEIIVQGAFVLSEEIGACFAALNRLEYLEVRLPLKYVAALRFYQALRRLTNLTGIKISHWDVHVFDAAPLTELQKLQYINCQCYHATNAAGEFLFPAVTQLKKLSLCVFESLVQQNKRAGIPKVVKPYAFSIEHLKIRCFAAPDARENYAMLTAFTRLTELTVDFSNMLNTNNTNLYSVLGEAFQLRALKIKRMDISSAEAMDAVCSLSALGSLTIEPLSSSGRCDLEAPLAKKLSQLTALTQLSVHGNLLSVGIFELRKLKDFTITLMTGINVPRQLTVLSNLERLRIYGCGADFPKGLFEKLTKLRELTVDSLVMKEDVLPTLATLPHLTALHYDTSMDGGDDPAQINLLSNLVRLTALTEERYKPLDYIKKGALPRLQVLRVRSETLNDEERRQLRERLPALRHFQTQHSWMG